MSDEDGPDEPKSGDKTQSNRAIEDIATSLIRELGSGMSRVFSSLMNHVDPQSQAREAPPKTEPAATRDSSPTPSAPHPPTDQPDNVIDMEAARERRQREATVRLDLSTLMELIRSLATEALPSNATEPVDSAKDDAPPPYSKGASGFSMFIGLMSRLASMTSPGQHAPHEDTGHETPQDDQFTRLRFEIDVPRWLGETISALFSPPKDP